MSTLFNYSAYKSYLKNLEKTGVPFSRGFRSRLAEALGCQNAYISQILNTDAHFSLEQGLKIAQFLNLKDDEKKYFLLLIEFDRAGTEDLKKYFETDLKLLRQKNLNIAQKLNDSLALSEQDQSVYYSSWIYGALHMLVTIPQFNNFKNISDALNIDSRTLKSALQFLNTKRLIIEKNNRYEPGPAHLHLGNDSSHIGQHHTNWRIAAIQHLPINSKDDVHYSTVSSLSLRDAEKLKAQFVQTIKDYVELIKPSKEETLYNFNLDFYSLIKN